jgi:hypothetical protein
MPVAPVVPNGKVILSPLEADLSIMILRYEIDQIREKEVRLVSCHSIDALREAFVHEDGFPSRNSCHYL